MVNKKLNIICLNKCCIIINNDNSKDFYSYNKRIASYKNGKIKEYKQELSKTNIKHLDKFKKMFKSG